MKGVRVRDLFKNAHMSGEKKVSKNVKKYVKKALKKMPELKYTTESQNGIAIDNAPTLYVCITDSISQGVQDNNSRIGDEVKLDKWYLRLYTQQDPAATNANAVCMFRIVCFQAHEVVDTGSNTGTGLNAIYNINRVLGPGYTGIPDITSPYNHDRRKEYTILYDKTWHQVSPGTGALSQNNSQLHDIVKTISLKKAQKRIHWIGNSATNAGNHLFCLILCQNPTAINPPRAYMLNKVTYTDS